MNIPHRILVLKNRAFGDSVIGLGAIQYIKRIFPQSEVVYGVPAWVAPLYKNVKGAADLYLPFQLNHIGDWWRMYRRIRRGNFDLIIELQQGGRSALFFKWFFRKKYFYHNHNQSSGDFILDQGVRKPIIQRDLDGCFSVFKKLFKISKIPTYLDYQPRLDCDGCRGFKKSRIVLGMVATRKTKMWPLEYYRNLVNQLDVERFEFVVPLSNSPQDDEIQRVVKDWSNSVTIVHKSLADLPLELVSSLCYVGNDTGLKHLCVALGIPTFTFFGPEEPLEWHPYDTSKHKYYYLSQLECRKRIAHYCGLKECSSMICMNELAVEPVVRDILAIL